MGSVFTGCARQRQGPEINKAVRERKESSGGLLRTEAVARVRRGEGKVGSLGVEINAKLSEERIVPLGNIMVLI